MFRIFICAKKQSWRTNHDTVRYMKFDKDSYNNYKTCWYNFYIYIGIHCYVWPSYPGTRVSPSSVLREIQTRRMKKC